MRCIDSIVSSRIIQVAQSKGWTLKKIAEATGLAESTVYYIKEGKRSLTLYRLRKLESALDIPIPKILLEAIDSRELPEVLRSQYDQLRKILNISSVAN
jgi:transcriptional regulator with XRE-family HTH domain